MCCTPALTRTPLWTVLLVLATRRRKAISVLRLTGLVLGLVGCVLILAPWQAGHISVLGVAYCLIASISYAVSYLYMSRHLAPRDITPTVLAAAQLIAASAWVALALPFDHSPIPRLSVAGWSAVGVLGIVGTGLSYVINYALVRSEGAVGASVVTYLIPVASVALGAVILAEPITLTLIIGALVVLAGVALSRTKEQA
jgi:drug/metabolite transporter (DMT)-like permease